MYINIKYLIMPIRKIKLLKNYYYHIYNRWYTKQIIFKEDIDYKRFYETILKYNKEFSWINIVSYSFLPNHFHLILRSFESGLEISSFMRKVQQAYVMYYRAKYSNSSPDSNLRWPFFEWRFKAKLISKEEYFYKCLAYVNFNPLKHKIVKNIDDYKWTSYHQLDKNKIEWYKDYILKELEY